MVATGLIESFIAGAAVTALLVWDGTSRGNDDLAAGFEIEARNRGLLVVEVRTDQPDIAKE